MRINDPEDISSELKRFRQLIAQNREERLRLRKNLGKVTRQLAKTHARARDAAQSLAGAKARNGRRAEWKAVFARLGRIFKSIEARNAAAEKCFDRLGIRCEMCAAREMTVEERATQIEGLRFEYLLAQRAHGPDESQVEKFAAAEELMGLL